MNHTMRVFFVFTKSNLYDHDDLVLAHCASANVSKIVSIGHKFTTSTSPTIDSV